MFTSLYRSQDDMRERMHTAFFSLHNPAEFGHFQLLTLQREPLQIRQRMSLMPLLVTGPSYLSSNDT